ncbi:MAG: fumarylacetoacetate hydrolase family protein [Thermoplasmata archaeon]|nr:fumarylacetoacetate hydrolase family protein [Thermoplasmata archaeon]
MRYYHFRDVNKRLMIGKIVCLARTYRKHAQEMNTEVPDNPLLFLKPASSVVFNNQSIVIPKKTNLVHHEVELGVVIGKKGKNIARRDALDYVLGYLLGLDITARDLQDKAKKHGWPWTISKGFDTFCPISDVVLKKDVENPRNLDLLLKVNGKIRQSSNTRYMVYTVEEIVAFVSSIMTLEPGDLILTGTPEGVGAIENGDIVEAKLGNFCSLKLDVVSEG